MALEAHDIYAQITVRMANVLGLIARHYSQEDAARILEIPRSTARDDVARAGKLAGCENQRELGRWWFDHRRGWLLWLAEQLGVDQSELAS